MPTTDATTNTDFPPNQDEENREVIQQLQQRVEQVYENLNQRTVPPSDDEAYLYREVNALTSKLLESEQSEFLRPLYERSLGTISAHCESLLPMASGYYQPHGHVDSTPAITSTFLVRHLQTLLEGSHEGGHFIPHSLHFLFHHFHIIDIPGMMIDIIPILGGFLSAGITLAKVLNDHHMIDKIHRQLGKLVPINVNTRDIIYRFVLLNTLLSIEPSITSALKQAESKENVTRDNLLNSLNLLVGTYALISLSQLSANCSIKALGMQWSNDITNQFIPYGVREPDGLIKHVISPIKEIILFHATNLEKQKTCILFLETLCFIQNGLFIEYFGKYKTLKTYHEQFSKQHLACAGEAYADYLEACLEGDDAVLIAWAIKTVRKLPKHPSQTETQVPIDKEQCLAVIKQHKAIMVHQKTALGVGIANKSKTLFRSSKRMGEPWSEQTRAVLINLLDELLTEKWVGIQKDIFLQGIADLLLQRIKKYDSAIQTELNQLLTSIISDKNINDQTTYRKAIFRVCLILGSDPLATIDKTDHASYYLVAQESKIVLSHYLRNANRAEDSALFLKEKINYFINAMNDFSWKLYECVHSDEGQLWNLAKYMLADYDGARTERTNLFISILEYIVYLLNSSLMLPEKVQTEEVKTLINKIKTGLLEYNNKMKCEHFLTKTFYNVGIRSVDRLMHAAQEVRNEMDSLGLVRMSHDALKMAAAAEEKRAEEEVKRMAAEEKRVAEKEKRVAEKEKRVAAEEKSVAEKEKRVAEKEKRVVLQQELTESKSRELELIRFTIDAMYTLSGDRTESWINGLCTTLQPKTSFSIAEIRAEITGILEEKDQARSCSPRARFFQPASIETEQRSPTETQRMDLAFT